MSITPITVRIIATMKNECSQFPINDSALYRVGELGCPPSISGSLNAVGSHSMAYEPRKHPRGEGARTGDACWPRCFLDPEVCQYRFQKAHNIPRYGKLVFFLFTLPTLTILQLLVGHKAIVSSSRTQFALAAALYSYTQQRVVADSESTIVWYDYDKLRKCDPGDEAWRVLRDVMGAEYREKVGRLGAARGC